MNSRFFRKFFWQTHYVFIVLLAAFGSETHAQRSSNWRIYRASDGLQDSVCVSVNISARSGIWVQHPNRKSVTWLDGYDTRKVNLPSSIASHIYEGRVGQIWSAFPGGVQELKGETWVRYAIRELANKTDTPLLPLRQGQVLVLASNRVVAVTSDPSPEVTTIRESAATQLGSFTDMIRSRDGGAWIAGKNGIAKLTTLRPLDATTPLEEHIVNPNLDAENFSALVEDDDGGVTCIARSVSDGKKIVLHWDGASWALIPNSVSDVMRAWRSQDRSFWEVAPSTLIHLRKQGTEWHSEDELIAAQYFDAAIEANDVFWIATSEGLYRHAPLIWQTAANYEGAPSALNAIATGNQHQLWYLSSTDLTLFNGQSTSSFRLPAKLTTTAVAPDVLAQFANQLLLVGNATHLFIFDPTRNSFAELRHPSGAHLKMLGILKDGNACLQVRTNHATTIHLETYDGQQFKAFADIPADAGIGNDAQSAFVAQNGTIWVCGDKGLAFYNDNKWQPMQLSAGSSEEIFGMVDVGQNKIWAAARDRILQYNGKDWSVLQSGFDHINGMFKGRDGSIWIASNNGVHRAYKGDWVANGVEEGLSSLAVREVIEDAQGHVWAATARGLNLYHPEADNDPPEGAIQPIAPESISIDGNVSVEFSAHDRWKQTFPDRLLFSYRLDEQDWSPMQSDRTVRFTELSGGKHFFQVRSMDRNWNVDPKPELLEFFVPVPWFRETRLVLIGGAAGAAVLFFAGLAFNRHRRLVHSYAEVEKIVEQRTRELDKANRELFQSQKMNALGTLAAGIAHDFNSILSIVKGSAQIIESNVDNPEKIRTRVDRIKTAVDQGAGIVKAMLGFSRSSDHQVTECDLNTVIADTIQLLGDRFQRDAEVKFEPGEKLKAVCIVKDFVQQIVLNFILNAAEAMPGTSKIIVRTGVLQQLPGEAVLVPEPAPAYAFVEVQDFGSGIAPEVLPRIFDPFFTTKSLSTKRGTGLGLSMAYELAKEMKCGLAVHSKVTEGSTFTLIVPITS